MKLLLDTHAFLWFIAGDSQLPDSAKELIEEPTNQRFLSIASLWEIAIKVRLGKLELEKPFAKLFPAQIVGNDIRQLPIRLRHLHLITEMPFHHRDPFDRILVAQALSEELVLVSRDEALDEYGVDRSWAT